MKHHAALRTLSITDCAAQCNPRSRQELELFPPWPNDEFHYPGL